MNKRRMYVIGLTALLLVTILTSYGVWSQGAFSHGEPGFDSGCYCHNGGIAIYVNGTGDGSGGLFFGPFNGGASFQLLISTNNVAATGVVPGLQQWESNQTDNSKLTFSPSKVIDGSAQDRSTVAGNITALYRIVAPTAAGIYTLTLYAQGALMQPIVIQVSAGSTTTSTSSTVSSTGNASSTSTSSSTTSTASTISTSHSTTNTTTTQGSISFTSPSSGSRFAGTQSYTISGMISPTPPHSDNVSIGVALLGSGSPLSISTQAVTPSGTFSYSTQAGGSSSWVSGTYVVVATDSFGATGFTTFQYTAPVTTTTSTSTSSTETSATSTTATPTVTSSTATTSSTAHTTSSTTSSASSTAQTTTSTSSLTTSSTTTTTTSLTTSVTTTTPSTTTAYTSPTASSAVSSTMPSTSTSSSTAHTTSSILSTTSSTVTPSSSSVPTWVYAVIAVLLIAVVAVAYFVKRLSTPKG